MRLPTLAVWGVLVAATGVSSCARRVHSESSATVGHVAFDAATSDADAAPAVGVDGGEEPLGAGLPKDGARDSGAETVPPRTVLGPPVHPLVVKVEALREAPHSMAARQEAFARLLDTEAKGLQGREALLLELVERGIHDPLRWQEVTTRQGGHTAVFRVSTDALTIFGVRIPVTALGAQRIADSFDSVLPTARILDAIWNESSTRATPCTLPPDAAMATMARVLEHSRCVDRQIASRPGIVANVGKHWVLSNHLEGHPRLAANYGWFQAGHAPIQTLGTRHDVGHTDYSQVLRLVRRRMTVDGVPEDIAHVGRSSTLSSLVSTEGPLRVWHLGVHGERPAPTDRAKVVTGPSDAESPQDSMPPLASVVAARANVTLGSGTFPIPPERFPPDTRELSRRRVLRQWSTSMHMPTDRLPEVALASHGAAFCGHRDVFFDVAHGIPMSRAEFPSMAASTADALACGRRFVGWLDAGASFFELSFRNADRDATLALFRRGEGKMPVGARFAPLEQGGGNVFCRDDYGPVRKACSHGSFARLLVSVSGGTVGVRANDADRALGAMVSRRTLTDDEAALVRMYDELAAYDDVSVAVRDRCAYVLEHDARDARGTFLSDVGRLATRCAVAERGFPGSLETRWVFDAADASAAQDLEAAIRARVRARARDRAPAVSGTPDDLPYLAFVAESRAGANSRARVSREGTRLTVDFDERDATGRAPKLDAALRARANRLEEVAAVVRTLERGDVPDDSAMRRALGER